MPEVVVERIVTALNDRKKAVRGSKIHVLGVAYKPDVGDTRESPAIDVMELLRLKGANVGYSDPYVATLPLDSATLRSRRPTPSLLGRADAVVILTNHSDFDYKAIVAASKLVIDARNATGTAGVRRGKKIVKL
jgi:UDP-N-acetyl-D-glucosamine dehydrogenase